jgi:hypothetical protein
MPRARRRRHRSVAKRGWGRLLFWTLLIGLGAVLAIGSLVEIHAQSSQFRTSTNTGYGALALRVVEASNRTGAQLAALMDTAPQLTNAPNPPIPQGMARTQLQQGLDQAVSSSSDQALQAGHLVPPPPFGAISGQFTQVMADRARAVSVIRTGIDQRLGMSPLPIAGGPTHSTTQTVGPLISADQATAALTAAGLQLQGADADYRALQAAIRRDRVPIRLPRSVWVPSPVARAALGSVRLGGVITALYSAAPFAPFHQLVITAVGLSPPAVATGGVGVVGDGCAKPQSTVPGVAPTVLPPTPAVSVAATVTNCGTVTEFDVAVSETMALADPPGAPLPPTRARGGTSRSTVTLRAGSSTALAQASFTVAGGHLYSLTLSIAIGPANQLRPEGSTQQFLLQISS